MLYPLDPIQRKEPLMRKTATILSLTLAALALSTSATGAWAHGNVKCPVYPKAEWKTQAELQQKLEKDGWTVRRVEKHHDCYEVYAKDAKGNKVEAFFDPKTFDRVEPK
jgi:hypothetical protein